MWNCCVSGEENEFWGAILLYVSTLDRNRTTDKLSSVSRSNEDISGLKSCLDRLKLSFLIIHSVRKMSLTLSRINIKIYKFDECWCIFPFLGLFQPYFCYSPLLSVFDWSLPLLILLILWYSWNWCRWSIARLALRSISIYYQTKRLRFIQVLRVLHQIRAADAHIVAWTHKSWSYTVYLKPTCLTQYPIPYFLHYPIGCSLPLNSTLRALQTHPFWATLTVRSSVRWVTARSSTAPQATISLHLALPLTSHRRQAAVASTDLQVLLWNITDKIFQIESHHHTIRLLAKRWSMLCRN